MTFTYDGLRWIVLLLSVTVLLGACKSTEKESVLRGPLPVKTAEELWTQQEGRQSFNTISAKVHVDLVRNGKEQSFNCKLRIREDSAVWVSIAPLLGIELFRMVITTDSVKLMDRLNKKYFSDSLSVLETMTKVPVSFAVLQSLLTGTLVDLYSPDRYRVTRNRDHYQMMMKARGKLMREYKRSMLDIPILHQMFLGRGGEHLTLTFLKDLSTGNLVRAKYSEFEMVNEQDFPTKMVINTAGAGRVKCELEWSRVKMGEKVNLPFAIPEKYKPLKFE